MNLNQIETKIIMKFPPSVLLYIMDTLRFEK